MTCTELRTQLARAKRDNQKLRKALRQVREQLYAMHDSVHLATEQADIELEKRP